MSHRSESRSWLEGVAAHTPLLAFIYLGLITVGASYYSAEILSAKALATCFATKGRIVADIVCDSREVAGARLTGYTVGAVGGLLVGLLQCAALGMLEGANKARASAPISK